MYHTCVDQIYRFLDNLCCRKENVELCLMEEQLVDGQHLGNGAVRVVNG